MSSATTKPQDEKHQGHQPDIYHPDILINADLMKDAVDGENREHDMGVWMAVRTYPCDCSWAFIM